MKKHDHKTAQHAFTLEYLKHNGHHPNIMDIYKNVSVKLSTLSMTTVYNKMDFLKTDAFHELPVRNVERMIFDTNLISESHLICTICGKMVDVEGDVDHSLLLNEIKKHGFAARKISIAFYGMCSNCKECE